MAAIIKFMSPQEMLGVDAWIFRSAKKQIGRISSRSCLSNVKLFKFLASNIKIGIYGTKIRISFTVKYPDSLAANLRMRPFRTNNRTDARIKSPLEKLKDNINTRTKLE